MLQNTSGLKRSQSFQKPSRRNTQRDSRTGNDSRPKSSFTGGNSAMQTSTLSRQPLPARQPTLSGAGLSRPTLQRQPTGGDSIKPALRRRDSSAPPTLSRRDTGVTPFSRNSEMRELSRPPASFDGPARPTLTRKRSEGTSLRPAYNESGARAHSLSPSRPTENRFANSGNAFTGLQRPNPTSASSLAPPRTPSRPALSQPSSMSRYPTPSMSQRPAQPYAPAPSLSSPYETRGRSTAPAPGLTSHASTAPFSAMQPNNQGPMPRGVLRPSPSAIRPSPSVPQYPSIAPPSRAPLSSAPLSSSAPRSSKPSSGPSPYERVQKFHQSGGNTNGEGLSWSRNGSIDRYKASPQWDSIKANRTEFKQGSRNIMTQDVKPNTYLWTRDLDPCAAMTVVHGNKVTGMHIDQYDNTFRSRIDQLKHEDPSTLSIGITGANDQGSAGKVMKVVDQLKSMGLDDRIEMLAVGEGYSSMLCDPNSSTNKFMVGRE